MPDYRITLQVTLTVYGENGAQATERAVPVFIEAVCQRDASAYDIDVVQVEGV